MATTPRRAVIYARLSVAQEASVSIEDQVGRAGHYARSHGWQVVGTFVDDGVSASKNRPEDRPGWRALLATDQPYDVVIIRKIDRLSRRITDFWDAVAVLQERGKTLVAIDERLDLSTTVGQMIAGVLAGFAQMEAEAIRDRVAAARRHLLRVGRLPGGTIPYGWRSVPNPDGPGKVLAQDPDRVEYVRGMVERVQDGASVYSVVQWLDKHGAPLPAASQTTRTRTGWNYGTVERLLRNPVLAGMVPYNPGNGSKVRGDDVVRDEHGLPVVDESVAIMSVAEWRALVKMLDERDSGRSKPRALRSKTSALLSGLVWCNDGGEKHDEPVRMHRGTTQGRPGYSCPRCHQVISGKMFEPYVIEEFLRQKGEHVRWTPVREVHEGGAALLPEIERRLDELDQAIRVTKDRDERARLRDQHESLLDLRDEKQREAPTVQLRWEEAGFFAEEWERAGEDVTARRAVLDDALERVLVRRGRRGRGLDTSRLTFVWRLPDQTGPVEMPDDETLARWAAIDDVPRRK